MLSANGLNVYILYFNMAATQKCSCRNLVGPSLSRPTLFCFGLAWSNQIAGKMYPEMDIHRTGTCLMFGPCVLNEIWITNLSSALIG